MNITGIPALVQAQTDNQLVNAVSTQVLSQSLDTQETIGQDMVKMMEQSVAPNLGANFDMSV
ncbi:MAG: YjfB family protein [Eubacterium sp.]|nr:YjfB family protein [Eubacterium sp.]